MAEFGQKRKIWTEIKRPPEEGLLDYKPFGFPSNTFVIVSMCLSPAIGLDAST
jgi:hypothetical protein